MKEYNTPSVISDNVSRAIPALIAGLSVGKALAAGVAIAIGTSLLKKDIADMNMPGLEPCIQ